MTFSIVIPTWNNLPYLQNCIESILEHSSFQHQLIVVVNEGKDGTIDWLEKENIDYIHHIENAGICTGLNSATDLVKTDYFVYLNDDMYVLPKWDQYLFDEISSIKETDFMLSSTMIEPTDTGNPCVIVKNFGSNLEDFKKSELITFAHSGFQFKNWNGASWPPFLVPTDLWKKVNGFSEEFSPGMYSDPDFSMKLWKVGVRYFKGIGMSRVYHFGKKSTRKLGENIGRTIFLKKWNISARYFYQNYLKMGKEWTGKLPDFYPSFLDRIVHFFKKIKG